MRPVRPLEPTHLEVRWMTEQTMESPPTPTIQDLAEAYALDAVDHAKDTVGRDLDMSPASIAAVEEILGMLHDALPKGFVQRLMKRGPDARTIETMSKAYGYYVGEVMRRAVGGSWSLADGVATLTIGDAVVWPVARVHRRITAGPEDNVQHYVTLILRDAASNR